MGCPAFHQPQFFDPTTFLQSNIQGESSRATGSIAEPTRRTRYIQRCGSRLTEPKPPHPARRTSLGLVAGATRPRLTNQRSSNWGQRQADPRYLSPLLTLTPLLSLIPFISPLFFPLFFFFFYSLLHHRLRSSYLPSPFLHIQHPSVIMAPRVIVVGGGCKLVPRPRRQPYRHTFYPPPHLHMR